jgi:hypothetical protein
MLEIAGENAVTLLALKYGFALDALSESTECHGQATCREGLTCRECWEEIFTTYAKMRLIKGETKCLEKEGRNER